MKQKKYLHFWNPCDPNCRAEDAARNQKGSIITLEMGLYYPFFELFLLFHIVNNPCG
jgi:hypothetical protein